MTPGRIIHTPTLAVACDRAGAGCPDRPRTAFLQPGTIWQCDLCNSKWVLVSGAQDNEPYEAWRILTDRNRSGIDQ